MSLDKRNARMMLAGSSLLALALALPYPALAQPADPKPKPAAHSKKSADKQSLTKAQAAKKYAQGRALDRAGDEYGAFLAYLEAGEAGHGLAQKRLGEIYDRGGPVQRDYGAALRWYEKARAQGIEIPGPHSFSKGH